MKSRVLYCALSFAAAAVSAPVSAERVARVDGLWCGTGLLNEFSLRLAQEAHEVTGTLMRKHRQRDLHGELRGNVLRTETTKYGALVLEVQGPRMQITGGDGPLALARGMVFTRATGPACTG